MVYGLWKNMKIIKIAFIVILAALLVYYYKDKLSKEDAAEPKISNRLEEELPAGERVKIFSIAGFSDAGKKIWEMHGKSADIFSEIIELYDIKADSYGDNVKVNLKADSGVFSRKTNDIELSSNVRILTDEGTALDTDTLSWDADEGLVYTDSKVFIRRKEMDITGTGAIARHSLNTAQLNHDIKVDLREPPGTITCDGPLEVDYEKNIAYFNNNVEVVDKETSINTDKAIAYFEPKKKSLKMVFCEGNVIIKRGEDITYSKQLTYIPGEGRVILEGRPKIIIRDTESLFSESEKRKSEIEQIKN
jgi:LPS export ABC transporter protein LptC